jgi:hypothetical protein
VKTTDVPFLQGDAMADTKPEKTMTPSTASAGGARKNLTSAAESSDPTAQSLLAELQTARLNENDEDAKNVLDQLAELGYSAE